MPEVWFTLRWPDDTQEECYSPSSVIHQYLSPGTSYSMDDFSTRAREALQSASNRVEAIYGYPCSRAMAQLSRLDARIAQFQDKPKAVVTCLTLRS